MSILVQKFGGTSVGTGERLLMVSDIIGESRRHHDVVAVVSAISGKTKAEGTTSLILSASRNAARGRSFSGELETIEANHREALHGAVRSPAVREETAGEIHKELTRLGNLLEAIQVIRELPTRSQDMIMGTGERLAARLLTACLADRGTEAVYTDLSGVVPDDEEEVDSGFFRRLQAHVAERCRPGGGRVPVVTGFFGLVPGGLLASVGRGYTDFTAALISAGIGNREVAEMQVWKEVEGILTADPRKVPDAQVLRRISPSEAAELTYFGSEVLHPFTMEYVVAARVPIRIKNTFNPGGEGTIILPTSESVPVRATAVTAKDGITIVSVHSNRMVDAYGFLERVFRILAEEEIVVDLVSTSEVSISLTVDAEQDLRRTIDRLAGLGEVDVREDMAILAMVGEGMRETVGTAGGMFSALARAGINIEMISQGASGMNISCVIKERDTEEGLRAVHRAFLEGA